MIKQRVTHKNIFIMGLLILNILMIIQLPAQDGKAFFSLLHSDTNDTFMDFFNSIFDSGFENPYIDRGVIYPPLAYIYYRLCGYLLPAEQSAQYWKSSQSGMVLAMSLTVFSMYILYKVLQPLQKHTSHKPDHTLAGILFGTVPFWYAIERGNLILQTLIFLAYFINNYQSEKTIKRELALISLAIAASFKIYPVLFGILLIIDKQYKEAVRCVVYGIIFFFLPFCFFGGLETVQIMIHNILSTSEEMMTRGWGYKVNIDNTLFFLEEILQTKLPFATIFKCIVLLSIIFVLLFSHKSWQRYMVLSAAMIVFPKFSYTYTLVFIAIPLLEFLNSSSQLSTRNLIFSFLFLCMFAPFPYGGSKLFDAAPNYFYQLNLTTVVSSFSLIGMLLLMPVDTFIEIQKQKGKFRGISSNTESVVLVRTLIILGILIVLFIGGCLYCNSQLIDTLTC